MVDRASALKGYYQTGRFGSDGDTGVALMLIRDLTMHQVSAWPDTIDSVGETTAASMGAAAAPTPCNAVESEHGAMLRVEPLKWWLLDAEPPQLDAEVGSTVDLSHSRTRIRITGEHAALMINRLLPLDLRDSSFPVGSVASSAIHHVGVTLWRSEVGYELFIPRGFALSVWEVLFETATQFGVEVI